MTEKTTTEVTDEIETETRTKTRVETEIEEIEETYEVTECQWCNGIHPVEDTVAIGVGQGEETVERPLGTITVEDVPHSASIYFDPADGVTITNEDYQDWADSFDAEADIAVEYDREYQTSVPFCSYCATRVFGIDREDALDAPAYKVYDDTDFGTTDDTGDGTTYTWLSDIAEADAWKATALYILMATTVPAVMGLSGVTIILFTLAFVAFLVGLVA